jgi:hypothetical protein
MKIFLPILAFLVLGSVGAAAQSFNAMAAHTELTTSSSSSAPSHDVTGFSSPSWAPGPGVNPKSLLTPPNPHPDLKPKLGGVFVDGVKYGPEIISPTAPLSWGMGEKYLSAPSQGRDLQHESGQAAHRDTGGLKLFSLEF